MTSYFFRLAGPAREREPARAASLADARAEAVRYLGARLVADPGIAEDGHWRLLVEDEAGAVLFHVIVAMVPGRGREEAA